jgi:hypothetical protein
VIIEKVFSVRPEQFGALIFLVTALFSAVLPASVVEPGHSAAWYDPARSGEGWVLEVQKNDRATVYWFTYDDEGGQRWMIGIGEVAEDENGRYILVPELLVTRGAQFGEAFNPDDVVYEVAGHASFRFDDCQRGSVDVTAFGQSFETTLQRLSKTMGAGCSPINGIPGEPVREYAGQSGNWFDPEHTGEGFVMQWLSRDQALAYWFTYDDEGEQAWMIGMGEYVDGVIEVPGLQATRGARFGADFSADDVEVFDWGAMSMELTCETGVVSYTSELPAFGEGAQTLTRLSSLASPACPYVQPRLTDLYDFEWTEIPIPDDGSITVRRVLGDGTVIGIRDLGDKNEGEVVVLEPGSPQWLTLPAQTVLRDGPVLFAPDSRRLVATEAPDEDFTAPFEPVAWWPESGWSPIAGIESPRSLLTGGSRDANVLVGRLYPEDGPQSEQPWIWDPVEGQRTLPVRTDHETGYWPTAASSDGSVVTGYRVVPTIGIPPPPIAEQSGLQALRWVDEGPPHFLKAPDGTILSNPVGCSENCEVIFGEGFSELEFGDSRLNKPKAWFWTPDGRFGVLAPVFEPGDYVHEPAAIDAAGTMIVGTAPSFAPIVTPAPAQVQAIAWTQSTGTTPLGHLTHLALNEVDWNAYNHKSRGIDISDSGDLILVEVYQGPDEEPLEVRAGTFKLIPKE